MSGNDLKFLDAMQLADMSSGRENYSAESTYLIDDELANQVILRLGESLIDQLADVIEEFSDCGKTDPISRYFI
jgi:hypothetical protein